jgi:uncharacterized membrane protein YeaQ/YmgE (transglycosylase-associated protein family)
MGLLWFLIVGIIAGFLAGKIMTGAGYGLLGDLVVGVVGSLIGGYFFGLLHIAAGGLIGAIITALVGAIVLIWLIRLLRRA